MPEQLVARSQGRTLANDTGASEPDGATAVVRLMHLIFEVDARTPSESKETNDTCNFQPSPRVPRDMRLY